MLAACVDVGSIRQGRLAWALAESGAPIESGVELEVLVGRIGRSLDSRVPVALGFECPMFVPVSEDAEDLGKARLGEGSHPWSAGAGSGVLATGIVQMAWLLSRLRKHASPTNQVFLNWNQFREQGTGILLWEAMVTGSAKGASHREDAEIAVRRFLESMPTLEDSDENQSTGIFSLVGAAVLWAGWTTDLSLLHTKVQLIVAKSPI